MIRKNWQYFKNIVFFIFHKRIILKKFLETPIRKVCTEFQLFCRVCCKKCVRFFRRVRRRQQITDCPLLPSVTLILINLKGRHVPFLVPVPVRGPEYMYKQRFIYILVPAGERNELRLRPIESLAKSSLATVLNLRKVVLEDACLGGSIYTHL